MCEGYVTCFVKPGSQYDNDATSVTSVAEEKRFFDYSKEDWAYKFRQFDKLNVG